FVARRRLPADPALIPYTTLFRSDGEPAAGVVGQRIAHRIGGGIGVRGECRDPDCGADRRVLVDRVGGRVVVERGRNRELVDVVDDGRRGLVGGRGVRRCRPHCYV